LTKNASIIFIFRELFFYPPEQLRYGVAQIMAHTGAFVSNYQIALDFTCGLLYNL